MEYFAVYAIVSVLVATGFGFFQDVEEGDEGAVWAVSLLWPLLVVVISTFLCIRGPFLLGKYLRDQTGK